ncbi:ATP-grasp domain-containing protein [Wenjunlia tyrosinilytica]|uniref:ATP-grasp domain-containing protein n=1 Tax=Wenjunlia tyrosinilytica TaxID=1544741 RepID=A0A917ZVN4_9ACTN|nr:ATP-grasp domain-containing protein [Wenjunlia tyrosinilytica]GGO94267.1 hypothetical protein GCM10012280_48720 [Wenjunlia tyrosinilytica]
MTGTVVLVESNTTGNGRELARAARRSGLSPLLLTTDASRYGYVREDGVPVRSADTANVDALLEAVHTVTDVAAVASTSEYYIDTAAALARKLGLPGPDPEAVRACRDKGQQRRSLAATGVPVPANARVHDPAEVARAWNALGGGPLVVKPVAGSGSVGVRLCHTAEEATEHARPLLAHAVNERGTAMPHGVLLEAYVDGPEFSVEAVAGQVVGVTAKHLGPHPGFVETGHDFPADGPPDVAEALRRTASEAVDALGLRDHLAHVELRLGAHGPVVIEVNPRLAGGCIPELVREALGVDLVAAALDQALGRTPRLAPSTEGAAAVRFLLAPGDGTVHAVEGLERARRMPGVRRADVTVGPHDRLRRHGDFRDRIGSVVTRADTPGSAARQAVGALDAIRVRLGQPGEEE